VTPFAAAVRHPDQGRAAKPRVFVFERLRHERFDPGWVLVAAGEVHQRDRAQVPRSRAHEALHRLANEIDLRAHRCGDDRELDVERRLCLDMRGLDQCELRRGRHGWALRHPLAHEGQADIARRRPQIAQHGGAGLVKGRSDE
jgi:hypothetical protein